MYIKRNNVIWSVICVALVVLCGVVYLYESGKVQNGKELVAETVESIEYGAKVENNYLQYRNESDVKASEMNFTGATYYRTVVNGEEIVFDLFYIDGKRVSADEFIDYTNEQIQNSVQAVQAAEDQAQEMAQLNEDLIAKNSEMSTWKGFLKNKFAK